MKTELRLFIYGALLKGQAGAVYMPWNNLIPPEEDFTLNGVTMAWFEMTRNNPSANQPRYYPGILSLRGQSDVKGKLLTFSFNSQQEQNAAIRTIDEFEYERRLMPQSFLTKRVAITRHGKRFNLYLVRTDHLAEIGDSRLVEVWNRPEVFYWPDINEKPLRGEKP